jgi:uncharacterized lipoprotein YddW (UPF0748 family)
LVGNSSLSIPIKQYGQKICKSVDVPAHLLLLRWVLALLIVALPSCIPLAGSGAESLAWTGVWVQARSITSPEMIDEVLQRADAGGFKAIMVNVFYDGQSLYDSALVEKYDEVDAGFDPLAYLVPQAHQRGIQVHAWFVVGRIDDGDSPSFWHTRTGTWWEPMEIPSPGSTSRILTLEILSVT